MTSKPESPEDALVLAAHDLALAALREITPAHTIGEPLGSTVEGENVVSLRFANTLAGYPGWFWTVSVARVDDEAPTVLEVELLPGEDALVAPDWVPWAVRLAEYQATQAALAEAAETAGDDDEIDDIDEDDDFDDSDDDDDDSDEDDADDEDDDLDGASSRLHAGDVDGVDIDELDDSADDDDDDDEPDGSESDGVASDVLVDDDEYEYPAEDDDEPASDSR